jgi:hypothetical protein
MAGRNSHAGFAAATLVVAVVTAASANDQRWTRQERPPLVVEHPVLAESVERLYAGSPRWREALNAVADTGRRIVVVTPDRVRVRDHNGGADTPFDPELLAEAQPIADDWSRVDTVVVVVNLPLLSRLYSDATFADLHADLDRILAHEIYGHAIPYLLAGHLSGKCADPLPKQRATDACAIKRENEIRSELRLGERREYGLDGLAMTRRYRY